MMFILMDDIRNSKFFVGGRGCVKILINHALKRIKNVSTRDI